MKLSGLNEWLTLAANLGVLAGLVFIGLEIRQNTRVVERELFISQSDNTNGQIVESDYLTTILTKIFDVQGEEPIVQAYIDTYDMTQEQAIRWWRFVAKVWQYNEADWIYRGKNSSECVSFHMEFLDHQLYYKHMGTALGADYWTCIDEELQKRPLQEYQFSRLEADN